MMPLLRLATLATIAIGLSGCATIRDWWSDEDKGPEPAPLVELKGAPDVKRLWSADSGKGSAELVLALNVAADEEAVFIADRSGTVSAFRAADGSRLWASETRAALSAGPGLAGDVVVVGGSEGEVIALDRKSGGTRWKARASSEVLAAPVGTDELVITRSGDGTVNVYATADGKALWSAGEATPPLSLRGVSRPLYVQGGIVAGFAGGKLTAFDGRNGAVLWDARVGVPSGRTELERIVDLDADPVRREDIVYVAAWQQHVAAVSLRGGDVVWRQPLFTAGAARRLRRGG